MKTVLTLCLTLFTGYTFAAELKHHEINPAEVRVVPVDPTPEADNVQIFIVFPKEDQLIDKSPVDLQMRLNGYPLANDSDFDRRFEIKNDPDGQSVRVFIDDLPYFSIYEAFVNNLDDNNLYFQQILFQKIPYSLTPGMHYIRTFPVRSYGESLKGEGCYQASAFYYKTKKDSSLNVDLSGPYLTYNEPQGTFNANKPILLDFYLSGVKLSRDGYKVRFSIDGADNRIITNWVPHYIYGLGKGKHTIQLQLIDPQNKPVAGSFNNVKKEIIVK